MRLITVPLRSTATLALLVGAWVCALPTTTSAQGVVWDHNQYFVWGSASSSAGPGRVT